MPVSKETSRRVLAAYLIAGGTLLALACGAFAILVFSMTGLVGAGNPSPETVAAGVREGRVAMAIAAGVGLIGVGAAAVGVELWLRGKERGP